MLESLRMRPNKSTFPSMKLNERLLDAVKLKLTIPSSQTVPDQGLICIHISLQPKLTDAAPPMVLLLFRRSCQLAAATGQLMGD